MNDQHKMSAISVISATNLKKTFVQGKLSVVVLKGINFNVGAGESHAIIGSSGAGKSTLMHLLGGLDTASEGDVQVMGHSIAGLSEKNWVCCVTGTSDLSTSFIIYYLNLAHSKTLRCHYSSAA
jgi:predicted ABC-type transport system involved in lysophospholipase L1 biosynthesis ATPase subunit